MRPGYHHIRPITFAQYRFPGAVSREPASEARLFAPRSSRTGRQNISLLLLLLFYTFHGLSDIPYQQRYI